MKKVLKEMKNKLEALRDWYLDLPLQLRCACGAILGITAVIVLALM